MSLEEFLAKIKEFQIKILDFIDDDDTEDNNTKKLQNILELAQNCKICDDKDEFKTLLLLITQISNDHYRSSFFYDKIIKILQLFVDAIKKNFTNNEIFHIFESNKRLLLFFLEEKIFVFNALIAKKLSEEKYQQNNYTKYFHKEIKPFNESIRSRKLSKESQKIFDQCQKDGENDQIICKLIREDLIEDFIIYINQNSIKFDSQIKQSMFETNSYLLGKDPTLIEYAAFFGSIRIFQYLSLKVELNPILWIFAIHGNNPEIIGYLEEKNVKPKSYKKCLIEAIKCHHNNIVNYIKDNYLSDEDFEECSIYFLKYYNFAYVEKETMSDKRIFSLNNSLFFKFFIEENQDFDINDENVLIIILNCIYKINYLLMKRFNFI